MQFQVQGVEIATGKQTETLIEAADVGEAMTKARSIGIKAKLVTQANEDAPRQSNQRYEYRMVQVPPTIQVEASDIDGSEAAHYLQQVVNKMAREGWDFYRVDPIGVTSPVGCLGALLGMRSIVETYYVITFRRAFE